MTKNQLSPLASYYTIDEIYTEDRSLTVIATLLGAD